MISIFQRLSLFVILASASASGIGCHAAAPAVESPGSLSFRPTSAGAKLWLATPFAIELTNETDARAIEAVDATYIGEISVKGRLQASTIAMVAAEHGATHYRIVTAGEGTRIDVVLYRVDRDRWTKLPGPLRPASPTASL